ncbi:MAG: glycosyltransferase family 4 protein [Verrucomicrobiales bacterium]|nr:glycosyltransferase family 4 protein [Verrucomicrobiales bacterium]
MAMKTDGGGLTLIYPENEKHPFKVNSVRPVGENLHIQQIKGTLTGQGWYQRRGYSAQSLGTRLPSRQMQAALRAARPDLVWVHELSPYSVGGMVMAKVAGRPVVVSTDVGKGNRNLFPLSVRIWHAAWGLLADGWIAQTPSALWPLGDNGQPRVAAYHAADARKLAVRDAVGTSEMTVFVQVGRVSEAKGVDFLLKAFAHLRDSGCLNWKLLLIGDDSDGFGRSWVEKLGLRDHVELTGYLDGEKLMTKFGEGDVFTLATRIDTYGAVVQEAACMGMPLVVSQYAGAAEAVVVPGVNGWIVDPSNTEEYSDRLGKLTDAKTRLEFGKASRLMGEKLSASVRASAIWDWMKENFL